MPAPLTPVSTVTGASGGFFSDHRVTVAEPPGSFLDPRGEEERGGKMKGEEKEVKVRSGGGWTQKGFRM